MKMSINEVRVGQLFQPHFDASTFVALPPHWRIDSNNDADFRNPMKSPDNAIHYAYGKTELGYVTRGLADQESMFVDAWTCGLRHSSNDDWGSYYGRKLTVDYSFPCMRLSDGVIFHIWQNSLVVNIPVN